MKRIFHLNSRQRQLLTLPPLLALLPQKWLSGLLLSLVVVAPPKSPRAAEVEAMMTRMNWLWRGGAEGGMMAVPQQLGATRAPRYPLRLGLSLLPLPLQQVLLRHPSRPRFWR